MGFKGGYRFSRFEGQAKATLRDCAVPDRVVFDPAHPALTGWTSLQASGTPVSAGAPLLVHPGGAVLPSPVSGTVDVDDLGRIVVTTINDSPAVSGIAGHVRDPRAVDRDTLLAAFQASGCGILIDVPPASFATIRAIIVTAVHTGPLDQAWEPSIDGDASAAIDGIAALRALMPDATVTVAVNRRNAAFFLKLTLNPSVPVHIAPDRHPAGHPSLLVRDILGRPLVDESGVRDTSVLVIGYGTVARLGEALVHGRPLVDRVVMAAGPGVSEPGWYRIRIGTPFAAIARSLFKSPEHGPWRIIRGDLFTGTAVDRDTDALLPGDTAISVIREQTARQLFQFVSPGFAMDAYAVTTAGSVLPLLPKRLDSGVHGGVRPCVQCNYCDTVCPVGIYPHIIWKHVEAESVEESFRFRPQDCIGCRLCDYVCPSKIDLSTAVGAAKTARLTGEETP